MSALLFGLALIAFALSLALERNHYLASVVLGLGAVILIFLTGLLLTLPSTLEQARQTNALATIAAATAAVDANATEAALTTLEAQAAAAATAAAAAASEGKR